MADGLDVVAVGVEHEGAVVARVVVRTFARRAVVATAGGEGGAVEGVHGGAIAGRDRHVDPVRR